MKSLPHKILLNLYLVIGFATTLSATPMVTFQKFERIDTETGIVKAHYLVRNLWQNYCQGPTFTAKSNDLKTIKWRISPATPELSTETISSGSSAFDYRTCQTGSIPIATSFQYLADSHYYRLSIWVEDKNKQKLEIRELFLNPWLAEDEKAVIEPAQALAMDLRPLKHEIVIDKFTYEFVSRPDVATLDTNLALVKHELFRTSIVPKLRMRSPDLPFEIMQDTTHLWKGLKFNVRGIFASTTFDDPVIQDPEQRFDFFKLISTFETVATIDETGQLIVAVPISYTFQERPVVESSTRLFFEISPMVDLPNPLKVLAEVDIDMLMESKFPILRHLNFVGDLQFIQDSMMGLDDVMTELELPEHIKHRNNSEVENYLLRKPLKHIEQTPLQRFLVANNKEQDTLFVQLDNRSPLPHKLLDIGLSREVLANLSNTSAFAKSLFSPESQKLCELYKNRPIYKNCLINPLDVLTIEELEFVESVDPFVEHLGMNPSKLKIMASFYYQGQQSLDQSHGIQTSDGREFRSLDSSAGFSPLKLNQFGPLNFKAQQSFSLLHRNNSFMAKSITDTLTITSRLRIRQEDILRVEREDYRFSGQKNICMLIRPNKESKRCLQPQSCVDKSSQALMICRKANFDMIDSWYYISDAIRHEMKIRRSRNYQNLSWLKLIRGRSNFGAFKRLVENSLNSFELSKVSPYREGTDYMEQYVGQRYILDSEIGLLPGLLKYSQFKPPIQSALSAEIKEKPQELAKYVLPKRSPLTFLRRLYSNDLGGILINESKYCVKVMRSCPVKDYEFICPFGGGKNLSDMATNPSLFGERITRGDYFQISRFDGQPLTKVYKVRNFRSALIRPDLSVEGACQSRDWCGSCRERASL